MAKYKVGDKVRIVSERPQRRWNPKMDKYLGKREPKIGDKFVVAVKGGMYEHGFNIGDVVTLRKILLDGDCDFCNKRGLIQQLHLSEVRPYKEKSK